MLLYDAAISGNCFKVRLLFAKLGIDYERRELSVFDRSDRPGVLGELNPGLRVPTLVLDDGRALAESGAILFHFAEGTDYLPADAYERAQERHLQGRRFLVGDAYSIADIALYAYTHVAPEGGFSLQPYPAIQVWLAHVADHPGHVAIGD